VAIKQAPEEIDALVKRVWSLLDEPRVTEARSLIEKLVRKTNEQIASEDPKLLMSLARALHAAGYITGLGTRSKEIAVPNRYYHELEEIARLIKDDTFLSIALTYQGDMYRRSGNITDAIAYLEAARDVAPKADKSARGNALQLLGRTYLLGVFRE